jgi:hypothetical protein
MKFNPKLTSYVFAFNSSSRLEEILAIRAFTKAVPAELIGYWKGIPERSYQVPADSVDFDAMVEVLTRYEQEAFLYISQSFTAYNCNVDRNDEALGKMVRIPNQLANCTYCITTETYWGIL